MEDSDGAKDARGCMFFLLFPAYCVYVLICLLGMADWAMIGRLVLAYIACGVAYHAGCESCEHSP